MAIHASEIEAGVRILKDLGARRVFLFGSALTSPGTARDLDLACEGLPPARYFQAVGALIASLGRDVDLIDLSKESSLTRFIRKHSRVVYEA